MKLNLNIHEYWALLEILETFEHSYGENVKAYSELISRIKDLEKQLDNH
ncbi:hypothetical protein BNCALIDO_00166 [Aeromonas phage vB_AdhM_TS9]|nr:hypothetical protein BNCALIDO_00166 [Aeromonas phage vB_AdhM_TS9]